jgi:hypothetical protein
MGAINPKGYLEADQSARKTLFSRRYEVLGSDVGSSEGFEIGLGSFISERIDRSGNTRLVITIQHMNLLA